MASVTTKKGTSYVKGMMANTEPTRNTAVAQHQQSRVH